MPENRDKTEDKGRQLRFMIAAPRSGSGKTVVTSGMLALLKRRYGEVRAFKCGPDYIDTMFHSSVMDVESRNLDIFLAGRELARSQFERYSEGATAVLVEGVMGYYDGLGAVSESYSSWELARELNIPTVLVIRARGASLSLAAEIRGFTSFREPSNIAGVILNECAPMLFKTLAPAIEKETGIAVLGCLPPIEEARFESRHLGLYTAGEISEIGARIEKIADALEENTDLERLAELCSSETAGGAAPKNTGTDGAKEGSLIAVARDEAFCFIYRESMDALRDAGAEIAYFSPLRDREIPEGARGLYIPGGYPELYAEALSENDSMRESVREAVGSGLPTVAECGGYMYLGRAIYDKDERRYPMCGAVSEEFKSFGRLRHFGYAMLKAETDSLLFRAGEEFPVHEFHYWDSVDEAECGDLVSVKPLTGKSRRCCYAGETLYAGFPHLYFAGKPELARRFVRKCEETKEKCGI